MSSAHDLHLDWLAGTMEEPMEGEQPYRRGYHWHESCGRCREPFEHRDTWSCRSAHREPWVLCLPCWLVTRLRKDGQP